ncbi:MAG: phosphatidate cytidylyltransferase [Bacilli bacterium]|nr:phosphatidate cytidylyltransferase [Bacilli bacterium]
MSKKLIETNEITPEAKASMKTRIITALVLTALCVPCLFLGGWFFFALSVIISIFVSYELVHVLSLKTRFKYIIYIASIVILLAFVYWIFIKNNIGNSDISASTVLTIGFSNLLVSTVLILVTAGVFFGISFICEEFSPSKVCYLISMIVIVGLCIQSFLYLRFAPTKIFIEKLDGFDVSTPLFKYFQSSLLLVYVILGTILNDIGAYFFGILFGKHKLNPRISPKKTWEGFYGGMIISFAFTVAFALIMSAVGLPLLPFLDVQHFYWVLLISAVMPIIANLGDFTFSAIKRSFGIKDFSKLLPGHGGVLDRIDSLLFVGGFVSIMVIFINNGWDFFK